MRSAPLVSIRNRAPCAVAGVSMRRVVGSDTGGIRKIDTRSLTVHYSRMGEITGMQKLYLAAVSVILTGCVVDKVDDETEPEVSETSQHTTSANGMSLNGMSLNGMSLNGTSLSGQTIVRVAAAGTSSTGAPLPDSCSGRSSTAPRWRGRCSRSRYAS
ncbi:MAG: hypothetical protein WKG01_40880 [Kofleriaceae bacterium]